MTGAPHGAAGAVTSAEAEAVAAGEAIEAALRERARVVAAAPLWSDLTDVRFAVLGLGLSGVAAANALAARGADVQAFDDKPAEALADALGRLDRRVHVRAGQGYQARPGEIAIVSPGLAPHSDGFARARAAAVAVFGELEAFWRLDRASCGGLGHPIVAITGTDGKTTTTMLVDHLLRAAGHRTLCAGNIGEPLCAHVGRLADDCVVVAEVSEFQLVTTQQFRPRVQVLTNVADDHLDWFAGDRAAYVASMTDPAERAGPGDVVVVNGHDPAFAPLRAALAARQPRGPALWWFSGRRDRAALHAEAGMAPVFVVEARRFVEAASPEAAVALAAIDDPGAAVARPMLGVHNADNVLAAVAAVLALGVPRATIAAGLRTFRLPGHRLEPAGSIGQVRCVDDSKATNPHAAIHGLRAVELAPGEALAWIGGGSDKDASYEDIAAEVTARCRCALLIGATAPRLAAALRQAGMAEAAIVRCDSLPDAVARGWQELAGADRAGAGVLLLSPACASFDMFRGYAHRGEVFQQAVAALARVVG